MDREEFRRAGHELIDWVADYLEGPEELPVVAQVRPGDLRAALPEAAPERGEPMDTILADFRQLVLPAVTHWNHPRFFAYFPANNSGPSVLGELLSAALGVNGMVWQSCPAATELEELTLEWLRQMIGLPPAFRGVLQDSASTSTLVALVCARERATGFGADRRGLGSSSADSALRVYASEEAHSSVDKAARIAGLGAAHVVRVGTDETFALDPEQLAAALQRDRQAGLTPCCVVATVGTTSSTALDPLPEIAAVTQRHGLWLHVDAALAGSAAILPELRHVLTGAEHADSLVFNPHKWLFTNFDCSAYFTRDPQTLQRAMAVAPEYLRTDQDGRATNFRDWGVSLGRRFRALKLWFVLRHYGVQGLRAKLRAHLGWATALADAVRAHPALELLAPVPLNTLCFRVRCDESGLRLHDESELTCRNEALLAALNESGRIYLTHTRLRGRYALRICVGQTTTRAEHVRQAWDHILATAGVQAWPLAL